MDETPLEFPRKDNMIEEVEDPTEVNRLPKKIKTTEEVEFNKPEQGI